MRALTEASGLRRSRRRLRFSSGHLFAAYVLFAITALIALRGMVDAHAGKASVKTPDRIAGSRHWHNAMTPQGQQGTR